MDALLDASRVRLDALREGHRRKMMDAAARAEMAAGVSNLTEASTHSTESERHREAFVALNVALQIFDELYGLLDSSSWKLVPVDITEEMHDAFFLARDGEFPEQMAEARAAGRGWESLPAIVYRALLASAPSPTAGAI